MGQKVPGPTSEIQSPLKASLPRPKISKKAQPIETISLQNSLAH